MHDVTLKQIAEILNISITTASKALKDYKDVSPKTRIAVRNLAEKLNFKPNTTALNLRNKESKTIGLLIPEIVHHFFSNVINGVIVEAENHGYLVIVLISNDSYELEKRQVELLLDKRVDGILVSLAGSTIETSHIKQILKKEVHLVMFDKISNDINCSKIIIDDQKAAFQATEKLILSGCKKIAHFKGPDGPKTSLDRFLGYKDALEKHHLSYHSDLVYTSKHVSLEDGWAYMEQALEEHPDLDGIFTITDLVAAGALRYCQENLIAVPDKISIMGFSNWFVSGLMTPSLSTVDQPGFEMGKVAFLQLLKEIELKKNQQTIEPETIIIPTSIVIRQSTKN
ncbi:MAG: LacI family transcriptional regulator [Flavobacteriales bacterium CG_4_9_14_3_um_filter_40_17]|nr:MAG: LacI family transcriptional regulator [Flavobacteriales bacterium CG_4_9_14_3_um_filter_40_17]